MLYVYIKIYQIISEKFMVLKKNMVLDLYQSVKIQIANLKIHGDKLKKYRLM